MMANQQSSLQAHNLLYSDSFQFSAHMYVIIISFIKPSFAKSDHYH